jgi:hypothetical protein
VTAVLLLFAATKDPAAAVSAAFGSEDIRQVFGAALGTEAEVDLATWDTPPRAIAGIRTSVALADEARAPVDRAFELVGVRALHDSLAGFPAGRLLNSMGPADAARLFWRGLRASSAAGALTGPDVVIVAGDLPSTRAAWHLLHAGRAARAFWGLRAAADELTRART